MPTSKTRPRIVRQRLQKLLLDALFPTRCASCIQWSRAAFCARCAPQLRAVAPPWCDCCGEVFDPLAFSAAICARCRAKTPHFRAARSAYFFEGPMRDAIHRFKYSQKSALAPRLAPYLVELLSRDAVLQSFTPDFLVAVPLHTSRLRQRGFNQSLFLARELSQISGVPITSGLIRTRATPPQFELNRESRAKNVRDAFQIATSQRHTFQNARVLLLDDVFTTGATLSECARTLKKAGAVEVCALTLARQA